MADEEFKMVVALETGEVRPNKGELAKSISRTIGHNPRIASEVFSTAKRVYVDRGSGILQPETEIKFDFELYQTVVQRIIRGLYWRETGSIASANDSITVIPANRMDDELHFLFVNDLLPQLETKTLNNDTVRYKFHLDENDNSFWAINIFERHTVFAVARHGNARPPKPK